jgi:myosin-crossreactive antigen
MIPTTNGMEVHTEEFQVRGLAIKVYVRLDVITKCYTVRCKALDLNNITLWSTDLSDDQGHTLTFESLEEAVKKARSVFKVYRRTTSSSQM